MCGVYGYVYIYTNTRQTDTYRHTQIRAQTYAKTDINTCTHIQKGTSRQIRKYTYTQTYTHTHTHARAHIYIHTRPCVYVPAHTNTCTNTGSRGHRHPNIHKHTHTHTGAQCYNIKGHTPTECWYSHRNRR